MKKTVSSFSLILFTIGILVSISSCSNSDDFDIFGAIHGTITDASTGQPIEGAVVQITPVHQTKQTDASGCYTFKNLEAQQYTILVQKQGYQPNRKTATVVSGEDFQIDIQLIIIPQ